MVDVPTLAAQSPNEVPESSYGVVGMGHDELFPFRPKVPVEVH